MVGRGAMGAVYAAYDAELDRRVAIKLLRPDASTRLPRAELQQRLLREAQAMARLQHPNVLAIHDVGPFEDGLFLAMDFVAGGTLRDWLRAEKRTHAEIVATFLLAGEGLAAAHRAGIIHRDFKPENVLVDPQGRVLVTDFGLARRADAPAAEEPALPVDTAPLSLTQTGALVGTPAYMAPEQFEGRPADARSDIFGFCSALYEALFGAPPFAGATLKELREAVRGGRVREPPRPSKVPARVRRAVLRGLRVDSAERFQTMEELLRELSADTRRRTSLALAAAALLLLAGSGLFLQRRAEAQRLVACRMGDGRIARLWDDARRKQVEDAFARTGAPAAAGNFKVADQGLAAWVRGWSAARADACDAAHVRGDESAQLSDRRMECLDERLQEAAALADAFAHADASTVKNADLAVSHLRGFAACADRRQLLEAAPLPDDPGARAKIARTRDALAEVAALDESGHYQEGVDKAGAMIEAAQSAGYAPLEAEALHRQAKLLFAASDPQRSRTAAVHAVAAAMRGRRDDLAARSASWLVFLLGWSRQTDAAMEWAETAEAEIARAGNDPRLRIELLMNRGAAWFKAERHQKALEDHLAARAQLGQQASPDPVLMAEVTNRIASDYFGMSHYAEALAQYRLALDLATRTYGENHPKATNALANLANLLGAMGDYDEALELSREALARRQKALGAEHREVAVSYNALTIVLNYMGRFDEAIAAAGNARRILEKNLGPDHPELIGALSLGSRPLAGAGRFEEAFALLRRGEAIALAKLGDRDNSTAYVYSEHADALDLAGRDEESGALYEKARAILGKTAADTDDFAHTLDGVGRVLRRKGRIDEALALHRQSLAINEKVLAADSLGLREGLLALGEALEAAGDPAGAREPLERCVHIVEKTPVDPLQTAEVRFALARVLWAEPARRERARSLAAQADEVARASPYRRRDLRERVAAWRATHR
jgi:serine/threonine-protein kinase